MASRTKTAVKQFLVIKKHGKSMRLAAEQWKNDYQILISTILSARTRDEVTIPVAEALFSKFPNPIKLAKANIKNVKKIIKPVNFYKTKAKNIVDCAKSLSFDYNSKVPHDINELLKLPGVGRKTANVFLAEQGKQTLPVDAHVFYISKKLGWAKNNNPHKVEQELKKLFPRKYWNKINTTLVRFGKTHTSRKEKNKILEKIKKIK